MSRRSLEHQCQFANGDACRVQGMINGRAVRFNATFLNLQHEVDGEQTCIVRINGQDPWSSRRNNVINVPFNTIKYK